MRITKGRFNAILLELIDENPIACRGVLRIARVAFSANVPTLGVTLGARPTLHVNLGFVKEHCSTEEHVKALIIHEFLHVLLNHTERFERITPELNLALDAVINAIIHRSLGKDYSSLMSNYYADAGWPLRLLRPIEGWDLRKRSGTSTVESRFLSAWRSLYDGKLVVDDLLDLAREMGALHKFDATFGEKMFLGNHSERPGDGQDVSEEVDSVIRETLSSMNGGGIWRAPRDHGVGLAYAKSDPVKTKSPMRDWEREAIKVLTECVTPDIRSARASKPHRVSLPVLTEGDKRGFLRALWSPFLPDSSHLTRKKVRRGTTQVYLDVSGSMDVEMDAIIVLLWRLRRHIRSPFWAFSDTIEPAEIRDGRLVTRTTGGTSMNAVLKHVAETRPGRAVVVTDGYIEACDPALLAAIKGQNLRAIVSRNGSPAQVERAGIPYFQLGRFPNDKNR